MNIWHGAVRSGKTVGSLVRWLEYVSTTKNNPLCMFGKTERTLRRNIVDPLVELLGEDVFRVSWGTGMGRLFDRRIYLLGANDERSEGKIRGLTLGGAYGDELTLAPESFMKMLMTRLSQPGAMFFGTTNPDSPNHYVKADYIDRCGEIDCNAFHFGLRDNPYLAGDFIRNLEREYTGLWRLRFIDGRWVIAEGSVYDMFDPARHLLKQADAQPRIIRWYLAVDYGTSAPFVALLVGHGQDTFSRDALYVMREWRWDSSKTHRQLTDREYSQKLREWLKSLRVAPAFVFVDPSALSFMLQLGRDGVRNVRAGDNEVGDGIRNVSTLLSDMRLYIHESCKGLVDEIYGYVWDPKAQERGDDIPLDTSDHGPDALRYAVRSLRPTWRPWVTEAPAL